MGIPRFSLTNLHISSPYNLWSRCQLGLPARGSYVGVVVLHGAWWLLVEWSRSLTLASGTCFLRVCGVSAWLMVAPGGDTRELSLRRAWSHPPAPRNARRSGLNIVRMLQRAAVAGNPYGPGAACEGGLWRLNAFRCIEPFMSAEGVPYALRACQWTGW